MRVGSVRERPQLAPSVSYSFANSDDESTSQWAQATNVAWASELVCEWHESVSERSEPVSAVWASVRVTWGSERKSEPVSAVWASELACLLLTGGALAECRDGRRLAACKHAVIDSTIYEL